MTSQQTETFGSAKKQSEAGKSLPYLPLAKYWNSKVCQQAILHHKTNIKKMIFNV